MDLSEYRSQFPIFNKKIYLNSCSLGALSLRSRRYVEEFLNDWDESGASAWYSNWTKEIDSVRKLIAEIINADESEIAFGHSISSILSIVASCFQFDERKKIVVTELDFPTSNYQWISKKPLGVDTWIIRSDDKVNISIDKYRQAVDDKTALVSTSHVFFTSGNIQDIAGINEIARTKGALCIFDGYQSVGQIPVNVHEMKIDMMVSGGLKWLLGGPGVTFLYVRKGLIDSLKPTAAGWFGTKNQFEFCPDAVDLHDDARRFETGTPALASLLAFKGGLEIVSEIGVDNIRAATLSLINELTERLNRAGFSIRTPDNPANRAAIVMVRHDNPGKVVKKLRENNIIVDYRNEYVRISPYFYNTSEDIEKFVSTFIELSKN